MVLEDPVEPFEQAIVGGEQAVARADADGVGDDGCVLVLRQARHLERPELAGGGLTSPPTLVELFQCS